MCTRYPMTARFQPITLNDLDTLLPIIEAFCEYDGHPFDEARVRITLIMLIENEAFGKAWLIYADDILTGYIVVTFGFSLEYYGRDAFIDEVFLYEPFRSQGLGTQTFAFVEQYCKDIGVRALHLEVEQVNTKAQTFYAKLGYTSHDRLLLNKWL